MGLLVRTVQYHFSNTCQHDMVAQAVINRITSKVPECSESHNFCAHRVWLRSSRHINLLTQLALPVAGCASMNLPFTLTGFFCQVMPNWLDCICGSSGL